MRNKADSTSAKASLTSLSRAALPAPVGRAGPRVAEARPPGHLSGPRTASTPATGKPIPTAEDQRVVILSGLSGAAKTAATKLFEDLGYTCIDNLPGELLPDLAELVSQDRQRFEKVAIVLDRSEEHTS